MADAKGRERVSTRIKNEKVRRGRDGKEKRDRGGRTERTLRESLSVALRHLLCSEVVTALKLELSHTVPNWLRLDWLDEGDGAFEERPSVCKVEKSQLNLDERRRGKEDALLALFC